VKESISRRPRILFIVPHPVGYAPGQRLKYEQFYGHFQRAGFELTTSSFHSESVWAFLYKPGRFFDKALHVLGGYGRRVLDLFRIRNYDVVYVFLWGTPFGPPLYEWLLVHLAKKIVYDIDDLVYMSDSSRANRWATVLKSHHKALFLMRHADHVVTCTPYLTNFVKKYNDSITDISSTINTDTYQPVNPYTNDGRQLVLGWSGSVTTAPYLYLLKEVLLELRKVLDFKLLVIGEANFSIPGLDVEARAWKQADEVSQLQRIDIGLYPLPDEPWVMGKSGLKALQYMALGIPPVATALGANFRVMQDGVSGFLVTTPAEWYDRILQLANDPNLRREMGQAARSRVEQYFSVHANAPVYLDIIQSVAQGRQPTVHPPAPETFLPSASEPKNLNS
jgi:L-malate glycosyltransferase